VREKTSPIVVIAVTVLLASAAFARPVHKGKTSHKPAPVVERRHAKPSVQAHAVSAKHPTRAPVVRKYEVHHSVASHSVAPESVASLPVAPTPQPIAEEAIHIRHNRKLHPEEAPAAPDAPRVATVDDFMAPLTSPPSDALSTSLPPVEAAQRGVVVKVAAVKAGISVKKAKIVVRAPVEELAAGPVFEPLLYSKSGRLIMPAALKGSHEILVHQNVMADRDGLDRVRDDADLEDMRAEKMLVAIPSVQGIVVDERLPMNRRYCRPWTAEFLEALARAHYARFHTSLQVNSAVRTVEFQERLRYTNGNAAPAEGETASPHLTGQAVDLAKHGLSLTEIAWLRGYLLPLVQEGKVDVEEEFQQACFHISVYRRYMPEAAPKRVIQGRRGGAAALATAIRLGFPPRGV
jgi:hypothetical protein